MASALASEEPSTGVRALPDQTVVRCSSSQELELADGSGRCGNHRSVPRYRFLPPPSDQTEEQARFECMRLVRAGAISDADLLRLCEQPLFRGLPVVTI